MKKILPFLFLIFISGFLPACGPKQSKPAVARPVTLTEPIRQALNSLSNPEIPVDSLSGLAEVEVEARGRKEFFQAALLVQAPNRLHISILDDLGQEQGRFVADGNQVIWIDHRKGSWEHLEQDQDPLKRVLKLPLTVEEFIQRILAKVPAGRPQEAKATGPNTVLLDRNQDRYEIAIHPPRLKTWQSFPASGYKKSRFQVSYENFQTQSERDFPQSILWIFRKPKVKVSVEFLSLRLNPDLPPEKFDTSAP